MSFKMVDLLESPKEQEETAPIAAMDKPCYPYGLCITLDEATMEKLHLDEMPEIGDMIHIMAMAKVTGMHASAGESYASKSLSLQITHMGLEDEDTEDMASKLYDRNSDEDEDE